MRPSPSSSTSRLAVYALVGLCASACTRGCSCEEGEKTFESIKGPVMVELVRETHMGGGTYSLPVSSFFLRVHASPSFDVPVPCDHVDMSENETGSLVGWRCKSETTWSLIRVEGSRHFEDCAVPEVGTGRKPDFAKAKPIADVAVRIAKCTKDVWAERSVFETFGWLVDAVRTERGSAGVGQFFADASDLTWSSNADPWTDALPKLVPGERAEVERALCPSLTAATASVPRYVHAARTCTYEAAMGVAAVDRLRLDLSDTALETSRKDATRWAALIAAKTRASDGGAVACATYSKSTQYDLVDLVHALVAVGRVKCPALGPIACIDVAQCEGKPCARADLQPEIDRWLAGAEPPGSAVRPAEQRPPSRVASRTAAALVQGPLPVSALAPRRRVDYTKDPGSGPECSDKELAYRTSCTCARMPEDGDDFCAVVPDGGWATFGPCLLRVDDQKRTIGAPRHACSRLGEACGDCCPTLECDWNIGTCIPARTDAGTGAEP